MHILIIDDEPARRRALAARLIGAGHTVEEADSVAAARALLARGDFDVALSDMRLPDGDGLLLLRESRQAGVDTAFVIVTALPPVEKTTEVRGGAFDYAAKPVSGDEVLNRLSQIAALRSLGEENPALRRAVGESGSEIVPGTLRVQMRRHESEIILRALEDSDGDRRIAAQRLGIGLSSLYRKIEELEIRDRARASP
jgi:DNA-binding NtrC family response regulator